MLPENLKKYFWDSDFFSLNPDIHKRYILERLLELGDEKAVNWLKSAFRENDIKDVLQKSRTLSKRSLNFWRLVLDKTA